ncbi:MAG: phosphatase PAP2 family protein [Alphaproteobacteria bacterium]
MTGRPANGVLAKRLMLGSLAIGLALAPLFLAFPEIDLGVAALGFEPGNGFPANREPPWTYVRPLIYGSMYVVIGGCIVLLAWRLAARWIARVPPWLPSTRSLIYVLACLAIGPGLVVNSLLKDNWGRPRPSQIEPFGGTRTFAPPLLIDDQCSRNCSFVSGEAAAAFGLVALGLAVSRRSRLRPRSMIAAALVFGAAAGFVRIMQGGHFLSDVVYAGVVVCFICGALYGLFFGFLPRRHGLPTWTAGSGTTA